MHGRHALLGPFENEHERSGRRHGVDQYRASALLYGPPPLVLPPWLCNCGPSSPSANRSDDTCRPSSRIRLTPDGAPPRDRTGFCSWGSSPVHRTWIVNPNPDRFAATSLIAAAACSPLQINRSSATDAEISFQSGGGSTSPRSARCAAARSLAASTAASKNPTPPQSHDAARRAGNVMAAISTWTDTSRHRWAAHHPPPETDA